MFSLIVHTKLCLVPELLGLTRNRAQTSWKEGATVPTSSQDLTQRMTDAGEAVVPLEFRCIDCDMIQSGHTRNNGRNPQTSYIHQIYHLTGDRFLAVKSVRGTGNGFLCLAGIVWAAAVLCFVCLAFLWMYVPGPSTAIEVAVARDCFARV